MSNYIYIKDKQYLLNKDLKLKSLYGDHKSYRLVLTNKDLTLDLKYKRDIKEKYLVTWILTSPQKTIEYLEDYKNLKKCPEIIVCIQNCSILIPTNRKFNITLEKFLTGKFNKEEN